MAALGPAARYESVGQHRFGQLFDVVGDDVIATEGQGQRLRGAVERDGGAGTGAQKHVCVRPSTIDEIEDVVGDGVIHPHRSRLSLKRDDVGRIENGLETFDWLAGAVLRQDRALGLAIGIADLHADQEPVELALGKRIGSLELVRVLGRDDEERRAELAGRRRPRSPAARSSLPAGPTAFAASRPVDLVGQHDLREQRPGLEDELAASSRGRS